MRNQSKNFKIRSIEGSIQNQYFSQFLYPKHGHLFLPLLDSVAVFPRTYMYSFFPRGKKMLFSKKPDIQKKNMFFSKKPDICTALFQEAKRCSFPRSQICTALFQKAKKKVFTKSQLLFSKRPRTNSFSKSQVFSRKMQLTLYWNLWPWVSRKCRAGGTFRQQAPVAAGGTLT